MDTVAIPQLHSLRHGLDMSPSAFGELRESNELLANPVALRERMRTDGYIFMRDYLNRAEVLEARAEVVRRLDAEGFLDHNYPVEEAVTAPGKVHAFSDKYGNANAPLAKVLYAGPMLDYYRQLLGGPVRHYDFTWFRCISGGLTGTYPHSDVVYMGRGTQQLYTSWTPLGDVPYELGGLMILEDSIHKGDRLKNYLKRDVDTYCENRPEAAAIKSGTKQWQWGGVLAQNPVTLRANLGGRWLTTEYRAGDVLTFSVFTVHASTDNQTNRFRLSSDSRYQLVTEAVDERWISIDGKAPVAHGAAGKRGRIC